MPEKGICHLQSPQTLVREPRLLGKHRNDLNYRDAQCNSNKPCVSQQPITFDNLSSPQRYSSKGRTLLYSLCKLPSRFLIIKPSQTVRFAHPGCIKLQRTGCYAKDPNRCNTPAQRQHYPPPIVSLCRACHCCQQPELTHSNGGVGWGGGERRLSIAVAAEGRVSAECDAFPVDILSKCATLPHHHRLPLLPPPWPSWEKHADQ